MVTSSDQNIELSNVRKSRDTTAPHHERNPHKPLSGTSSPEQQQTTPSPSPAPCRQQIARSPATAGLARDFYALERTWLAYNRTANTLASHAIIVSQLFFLHEGRKGIGRICAIVMISGGIILELIGAIRYLTQSRGLLRADETTNHNGRAISGGNFVVSSAVIVAIVCCGLFVLVLVVA